MVRVNEGELLDDPDVPDAVALEAYRDMFAIHRWLGDMRVLARTIRRDPLPVRRILDVGCGAGLIGWQVGRRLGVEVIGADLRPRAGISAPLPIVRADACRDPLPFADVAFSMNVAHHLDPQDLVRLVQNVGLFCRRFILIDLVRHRLPLTLFRALVAPLLCPIDAEDGRRSIRRSYTPRELRDIVSAALDDSGTFQSSVSPLYTRQVIDIAYGGVASAQLQPSPDEVAWAR